jgi:hypothetical protein
VKLIVSLAKSVSEILDMEISLLTSLCPRDSILFWYLDCAAAMLADESVMFDNSASRAARTLLAFSSVLIFEHPRLPKEIAGKIWPEEGTKMSL